VLPYAEKFTPESLSTLQGSDDDDDDDDNSDESSNIDRSSDHTQIIPKQVARNLVYISDAVNELYRVGTLIRRPRLSGRYLHSTRSTGSVWPTQKDYQHVREKLRKWQRQPAEDNDEEIAAENSDWHDPVATPEHLQKRDDLENRSETPEFILSRRLAMANVKRRLQLRYWEAHPYSLEQDLDAKPKMASAPLPTKSMEPNPQKPAQECDGQSIKPPATAVTFSTVAKSAVVPSSSMELDAVRTVYEPSIVGQHAPSTRVPDLPTTLLSPSMFQCPYCHMMLETSVMQNRLNWKLVTCPFIVESADFRLGVMYSEILGHMFALQRFVPSLRSCTPLDTIGFTTRCKCTGANGFVSVVARPSAPGRK
jgi:hypothetical protein